MSLFWWRVLGVTLILIGLAGVGFGIYDLVVLDKIGGASGRSSKNAGPFILVVLVWVGWTCLWEKKSGVILTFFDTAFKPKFPAKRGDMIVACGILDVDNTVKSRVFLSKCELVPEKDDAIPAEQLTFEFLEDQAAAREKYLSDVGGERITVRGVVTDIDQTLQQVVLRGHQPEKGKKPDGKTA